MDVDKFGRYNLRVLKNDDKIDEIITLLADGNLNAHNKILKNIGYPVNENDGANKKYVDKCCEDIKQYLTKYCKDLEKEYKFTKELIVDINKKLTKIEKSGVDTKQPDQVQTPKKKKV